MKKNTFIAFIFSFILLTLLTPQQTDAAIKAAGESATLSAVVREPVQDNRAQILQAYLERKNSPLASHAKTFITEADKNNLDWKFVAAISGLESSFGLAIPPRSYNGWGWGVYGTHVHYFTSWDDAIVTISKGLRDQYMNKWGAKDIYGIGRMYAASPTWAIRVTGFMNDIDAFSQTYQSNTLSISL